MHGIGILMIFALAAFTHGAYSSLSHNWQSSWIMGGVDAPPGKYPFMVSLTDVEDNNQHFCGGSVINTWYILTAAHCFKSITASSVIAVVGTNKLNHPGQRYGISQIKMHPSYQGSPVKSDIALIRAIKPIAYSSTVRPVALPRKRETPALRSRCMLLGWGKTHPSATSHSNKLQELLVIIISTNECRLYYPDLPDTKLCALTGPGNGAALGDSGGPLICGGKQVGVYGGGGPPGRGYSAPFPMIFTPVPLHVEWIKQHTM